MTTAHGHSDDTPVSSVALIFAQTPLRNGVDLDSTARFGEDVWDLSPAVLQKRQRSLKLDFATLPGRYRLVAEELFYAQLSGELPESQRRPRIVTIRVEFTRLKIFFEWPADQGVPSLAEVGPQTVDAYRTHLVGLGVSATWRAGLRATVRRLWVYRDRLISDRLGFDPASLERWDEGVSQGTGENTTGRIPEAVLGPLLGWALRYVQEFAGDILGARAEWAHLYSCHWRRRHGHRAAGSKTAQPHLIAVLERYREAGRPLPGGPVGLSISHLAREVDIARNSLKCASNWVLIEQAIAELGIDDDAYLWCPMTAQVDGRQWLERMSYRAYSRYEQRLNAACYIVIAYLSGMGDSEVKHLRRRCLTVEADTEGRLARYKVTSRAFRVEGTPLGVEATWVVGAPVAQAVRVLEQLQPAEQEWLFAALPTSHHHRGQREGKPHTNEGLSGRASNDDIAGFITWINDYCTAHGLREYGRHVRFPGTLPRDRRQLAALVAWHDQHVYPGRYVTCVHNPDRALCHNGTQQGSSLGECQPLACRSVALTTGDALAPNVRERLRQRREQIGDLLEPAAPPQDT